MRKTLLLATRFGLGAPGSTPGRSTPRHNVCSTPSHKRRRVSTYRHIATYGTRPTSKYETVMARNSSESMPLFQQQYFLFRFRDLLWVLRQGQCFIFGALCPSKSGLIQRQIVKTGLGIAVVARGLARGKSARTLLNAVGACTTRLRQPWMEQSTVSTSCLPVRRRLGRRTGSTRQFSSSTDRAINMFIGSHGRLL